MEIDTRPRARKPHICRVMLVSGSAKKAPGYEQGAIAIANPLSRRSLCRSWHLTQTTTRDMALVAGCRASQGRFPPPLRIRQHSSVVAKHRTDARIACQGFHESIESHRSIIQAGSRIDECRLAPHHTEQDPKSTRKRFFAWMLRQRPSSSTGPPCRARR